MFPSAGNPTPALQDSANDSSISPTRANSFVGTKHYMAPEVLILAVKRKLTCGGYTRSVDFWSLGVMIYKLLTGTDAYPNIPQDILLSMFPLHVDHFDNYQEAFVSFFGKVDYDIHDKILNEATRSILHGLLEFNAENRLGYNADDIKAGHVALMNHAFFSGIDWTLLESKQVPPPYIPKEETLEILHNDHFLPRTLPELLREAGKGSWCEEFNCTSSISSSNNPNNSNNPNIPHIPSPAQSPKPNKQSKIQMRIHTEDQLYFQQWYYVNPRVEEKEKL